MNTHFISRTIVLLSLFFLQWNINLNAQQWQRVTALPPSQMSVLYVQGDTLYVAGLNKIYFSHNNGNSWDSTSLIHPSLDYITAIRLCYNQLFVSTLDMGIWRSADYGVTWQLANAGLNGIGAEDVSGLAVRGDSLYASTYGSGVFVRKTTENNAWSAYNFGMPWANVESITNIDDKLFAGAGGNGTVSQQAYPGDTWKEVPFATFDGDVNSFLGVIKQDEVLLAAGNKRLYRSTDEGAHWAPYNPGVGLVGFARFTTTGNRTLVLLVKPSGAGFMQYTDDAGLTWNDFQPALTGSAAFDAAFHNGWLYAARSNGLWRIGQATPVTEAPARENLETGQNFPNPFSTQTIIPINLPQSGKVVVSIFNSRGDFLRTIWSGFLSSGTQNIVFDAGDLPAGTYVYRVNTEQWVVTRTMIKQ